MSIFKRLSSIERASIIERVSFIERCPLSRESLSEVPLYSFSYCQLLFSRTIVGFIILYYPIIMF